MLIDTVLNKEEQKNLTVEQCQQWWEEFVSHEYFTEYAWSLSQPQHYAKIPLNKDSFILEIGCGYGRQISQFLKITPNVYGVDISKSSAELTKKHCSEAIVSDFDGSNLPFLREQFDLITSVFVMQHTSKENVKQLLKESYRILNPGGFFLHEFLGGNYIVGKEKEHYSVRKIREDGTIDGMYNNGYTQEEIKEICQELGLPVFWIEEIKMLEDGTTNIWLCIQKDPKEDINNYKEKWNKIYSDNLWGYSRYSQDKAQKLENPEFFVEWLYPIRELKKEDVILEIGCGQGHWIQTLFDKVKEIYGTDISQEAINQANHYFRDESNIFLYAETDLISLFPKKKFDVIYSITVFQHLPKWQILSYFKQAQKILKEGGIFFFNIFAPNHKFKKDITLEDLDFKFGHPSVYFEEEELINELKKAGFKSIVIKRWHYNSENKEDCWFIVYAKNN